MNSSLAPARLYLLATRSVGPHPLLQAVGSALEGGVSVVQVREKLGTTADRVGLARELLPLCRRHGALLIVNDDLEAARVSGADGVHLGQDDASVADARRALPAGALVGVSTHDAEELDAALAAGADYVGVGSAFPTHTKGRDVPVPGLAEIGRLTALAEAAGVAAFAIGGITTENVAEVVAAGARRVAVCAGILATQDPRSAAASLVSALRG